MSRVHIITEGATEEMFVNDVLVPHLSAVGIYADAHSITTRRDKKRHKNYRGGLANVEHLLKDVNLWLKEECNNTDCWVTTMVDLYAFPYDYDPEWKAGYEKCTSGEAKANFLEQKLSAHFSSFTRFIPYVQLHEYEALLLSDPASVHRAFHDKTKLNILQQFQIDIQGAPESINTGRETAPSKRIIKHYPEYDDNKATYGSLIADDIGLDVIRTACPRFNAWLTKLEQL